MCIKVQEQRDAQAGRACTALNPRGKYFPACNVYPVNTKHVNLQVSAMNIEAYRTRKSKMGTGKIGTNLILSEVLGIIARLQNDSAVSEIQYVRKGFCYFTMRKDLEWTLRRNEEHVASILPISASCKVNRRLSYDASLSSPVESFNLLVKTQHMLVAGMTFRLIVGKGTMMCKVFNTKFDGFMGELLPPSQKTFRYFRLRVLNYVEE